MEKITISEYARRECISVQAAHKRILLKKDARILSVDRITTRFFIIKFNGSKTFVKKCNNVAKIKLV